MPVEQDERVRTFGTKVRLFPQAPFLAGFSEPEVVWLSPPAGTVGPGPSDDRMYVVDAVEKPTPYEFPYLPPFYGAAYPPVTPGPEGHFDHLDVTSRHFLATHLYGSLRRVLDIFESYFGRPLEWHFRERYKRLEIIPSLDWDNAQSGYGFMEFGYVTDNVGHVRPFGLNFDAIAHELGHAILFSVLDVPLPGAWTPQFGGFHEASSDLVALVSAMHFETVLDRLLRVTRGNISTLNELNRISELSDSQQIRIASNSRKMSEVTTEVHDISRPLTGAFFDLLVYVFCDELYRRNLIGRELWMLAQADNWRNREPDWIQAAFDEGYKYRHFQFKAALMEARDALGARLAATWSSLSPNLLRYSDVARACLAADRRMSGDRYQCELRQIFAWREIATGD